MKKPSKGIRVSSPGISRARNIRGLRTLIGELKVLCAEAATILNIILIDPSRAVVRELCARFRNLQAHFSSRYREAHELAVSILGSIGLRRNLL